MTQVILTRRAAFSGLSATLLLYAAPPAMAEAVGRGNRLDWLRRAAAVVKAKVTPPQDAIDQGPWGILTATVGFRLQPGGRMSHVKLLESCGNPVMDQALVAFMAGYADWPPPTRDLDYDTPYSIQVQVAVRRDWSAGG